MKTAILAIVLFCIMIFPHELGHFIAARIFGVRVNEFSFGMGPRLFHKKKGETDYSVRLFPIGGYCAMDGEDGEEEDDPERYAEYLQLYGSDYDRKSDPALFSNKKNWQKIIILFAGSFINVVVAYIIMVFLVGIINQMGVFEAIGFGFTATGRLFVVMYESLAALFTGQASVSDLSGPIGMVHMVSETSMYGGWYYFFLTALISINLAVINMLPLPALDGGRIIFVLYSMITGKKVSPKVENIVHVVGFVLLIGLMLYVTYNDVLRYILH